MDTARYAAFDPATGGLERSARLISVDVDQIDSYEGNARLIPNTKREELKQITLRDGAPPGQLVVTRRPGAARFVLARGGNTRLAIVKELREEHPDDPRWRQIMVLHEPYVSEMQLAVNALQENEARGELMFIETSLAFCRVYDLWKAAQPDEQGASIPAFLKFFGENFGRPPARAEAYRMKFATDTLYPIIPTALVAGRMSSNAVRRLAEYRNKLSDLWVTAGFGEQSEFEEYFYAHLGRQERDLPAMAQLLAEEQTDDAAGPNPDLQIDYNRLSAALANEMARVEHVDVDEARIRDWIDDVLRGTPVEYIAAAEPVDGSPPDPDDVAALGLGRYQERELEEYDTEDISDAIRQENAKKREQVQRVPEPPARASGERPMPLSIAGSRQTAFSIARRIAERNRFGKLLIPYEHGIGYLVTDTILKGNDEPVPLARAAPWWVLVSCGMILELPREIADRHLPEESFLRESIATRQFELISLVMGPPASFGRYVVALNDMDTQDFLLLIKAAQQIIRTVGGDDLLWGNGASRTTSPRQTSDNTKKG